MYLEISCYEIIAFLAHSCLLFQISLFSIIVVLVSNLIMLFKKFSIFFPFLISDLKSSELYLNVVKVYSSFTICKICLPYRLLFKFLSPKQIYCRVRNIYDILNIFLYICQNTKRNENEKKS